MLLHRVGVLKMPTRRKNIPNNPKNNKIDSLEKVQIDQAQTQLLQAQIIEQHEERFEKGNERFKGLEDTVGKISVDVGILLDRTER